jgi:hypothetical protein
LPNEFDYSLNVQGDDIKINSNISLDASLCERIILDMKRLFNYELQSDKMSSVLNNCNLKDSVPFLRRVIYDGKLYSKP